MWLSQIGVWMDEEVSCDWLKKNTFDFYFAEFNVLFILFVSIRRSFDDAVEERRRWTTPMEEKTTEKNQFFFFYNVSLLNVLTTRDKLLIDSKMKSMAMMKKTKTTKKIQTSTQTNICLWTTVAV